jgi:RNA polymerase sigma-70 factor, ECF subfamily
MSLPAERITGEVDGVDLPAERLPDNEVVDRVLGGEVALFELLLRRYNQRLFRVARSIIGEDAEAEDIVQEAYVRAFQNLRQFEGRSQFATWLTKIAVNEATSRRRKRRRLRLVGANGDADIDSMANYPDRHSTSEEPTQTELREVLARAVDALPAELRTVFTLRMVEQLSTDETAECLELTPANVKVRLHRARAQLQAWIDRQIGKESRELFMFAGGRCDRIVANVMARVAHP